MAQNFQLSELAQFVTINSSNTVLLSANGINSTSYSVGATFIANSSQLTITTPLSANSSVGTSGQVLTSNGTTGSPYWSTVSGGGGSFSNGASIAVSNLAITNSGGGSVGVAYMFVNATSNSVDMVFV